MLHRRKEEALRLVAGSPLLITQSLAGPGGAIGVVRGCGSRLPINNLIKPPPSTWFELECCNGCNAHLR